MAVSASPVRGFGGDRLECGQREQCDPRVSSRSGRFDLPLVVLTNGPVAQFGGERRVRFGRAGHCRCDGHVGHTTLSVGMITSLWSGAAGRTRA